MEPELLAGRLNTLKKRTDGVITDIDRGHLKLAASYLIAVQDLRDMLEDALKSKEACFDIVTAAVGEFDDAVKPEDPRAVHKLVD